MNNSRYIWFLIALFLGIYLLVSRPSNVQNAEDKAQVTLHRKMVFKEYNTSGMIMPIMVIVHPSKKHLNRAWREYYNVSPEIVLKVAGWYDIDNGVCEIHVLDIIYVKGDSNMTTWGHELTHCTYGNFHPSN